MEKSILHYTTSNNRALIRRKSVIAVLLIVIIILGWHLTVMGYILCTSGTFHFVG